MAPQQRQRPTAQKPVQRKDGRKVDGDPAEDLRKQQREAERSKLQGLLDETKRLGAEQDRKRREWDALPVEEKERRQRQMRNDVIEETRRATPDGWKQPDMYTRDAVHAHMESSPSCRSKGASVKTTKHVASGRTFQEATCNGCGTRVR